MATIKKDFSDYLTNNKSNIDLDKLKWLNQSEVDSLYNEWKDTWSLPKSYMKQTPVQTKEIKPPINTPPTQSKVETTPTGWKFGTTASGNIMDDKLKETWKAFEWQQKQTATDLVNAYKAWGKEESELIKQRDEAARARYAEQQKQLNTNKAAAEARIDQTKQWADELLKRQEWIAARQANMAAAQAGESWLQMSASAVSDIKNDIIAKYGSNLANAEQFRLQTNMTLNDALTKVAGDTFKDKQSVDLFLNKLDESEYQPLLNAVQKATEWNVQAVKDIKDFYNKITQTKADEEYRRFSEDERYADNERNWASADPGKKLSLLQAELKQLWITDPFIANPEKFANMSFAEALNTISKDSNNKALMDQIVAQASATPWFYEKLPASFKKYVDEMWAAWLWSQDRLNRTAEQKKDKIKQSEQMIKTTSDVTKQQVNKNLSAKSISQLDAALVKLGKDKVLAALKKWLDNKTITQSAYDNSIRYINSK